MKKSIGMLGTLALMMAATECGYPFHEEHKPLRKERPLTDKQKADRHRLYGGDQTMHEYVINGLTIRATSKKTAKKIFERIKNSNK